MSQSRASLCRTPAPSKNRILSEPNNLETLSGYTRSISRLQELFNEGQRGRDNLDAIQVVTLHKVAIPDFQNHDFDKYSLSVYNTSYLLDSKLGFQASPSSNSSNLPGSNIVFVCPFLVSLSAFQLFIQRQGGKIKLPQICWEDFYNNNVLYLSILTLKWSWEETWMVRLGA